MAQLIQFYKYQGTGNDFVMLDNMDGKYDTLSITDIQLLCNRKLGVGADGLIKLSSKEGYDFEVEYYNSDGTQSFCGNGARCSVAFASELGLIQSETSFYAIDGDHKAIIKNGIVELEMKPVSTVSMDGESYVIDTGSPHFISLTEDIDNADIVSFGRQIRYNDKYKAEGINVNQMEKSGEREITVKTYERGVEDETLSCGTGVTACALAFKIRNNIGEGEIVVNTEGGELKVRSGAYHEGEGFNDIWLCGPAKKVFDGTIEI